MTKWSFRMESPRCRLSYPSGRSKSINTAVMCATRVLVSSSVGSQVQAPKEITIHRRIARQSLLPLAARRDAVAGCATYLGYE
ncbi:hypothetical protein ABIB90_008048 [Bradyrhizobium sp. JR4.1]